MTTNTQKLAIGTFAKREEAEQAIDALKGANFPLDHVSVIAKHAEGTEELSGAQMSDRIDGHDVGAPIEAAQEATTDAIWGGTLVGLTSLAIPGAGPVLAAGTLGVALLTGVAGAGVSAIASRNLVKAIEDLGIPKEQARGYSDRLLQGDYLVLVKGNDTEIQQAEPVLSDRGIQTWGTFDAASA
jgi:hypothetical protein